MADQVKITDIDALEAMRSSLIVFVTNAHRSVDEVGDAVRRTRVWIQSDQRMHWEGQIRRRRTVLDQANQELLSAKLSGLRDSTTTQEAAVRKAKHALAEAEEKLRAVKIWARDYDHQLDPLTKRLESLRRYLNTDLPKAIAYLLKAQQTLESYSESAPPPNTVPAPAEPEEAR